MRILYLADDIYSLRGGTEQHLFWLLRKIPTSEFEKRFIIFSSLHVPNDFISEPAPIILGQKFGLGFFSWLRRFYFLLRYIRKHKIELIQAFSPTGEFAAALAAALSHRGIIVIGNRRDCGYDRPLRYRWMFWLARKLGVRYIANSEAARQAAFHNDKTPLKSITVIRNPIAFDRIKSGLSKPLSLAELPLPNATSHNRKIVGMVATIRPIKDYATLIRAAKIILAKFPDTQFLFVGEADATHQKELTQLAIQEKVSENIIWYGGVDNPLKLVALFDVAVLSSHSESFSNAVLEYAAAAKPIVISDVGGLNEIIQNNHSGFLVPPENPTKLAEKIITLLENTELAKQLGKNAKEITFQNYNEEKILNQYVEYYKTLKK
ncbi:MAG: glycosyltransferase family 4 protein [Planctomycetaceae bacterium]|jgi:glycosyltransferase involved in cell wall biosynthesis|nr:glycosyltransferase family 4 protein [Planctomycetaceae bacterium]